MNKQKIPFIIISVLLLVIILLLLSFILVKPCANCGADGIIRCSVCKKGKLACETCNSNGYLYCDTCKGYGDIKCSDCNQKGYTTGGTCRDCAGSGRGLTSLDLSNIGSSELLSRTYKNVKKEWGFWSYTCTTCDGSGIEHIDCGVCNGDGKYRCPGCNGDHFGDICPDCNGATVVSCLKCDGAGTLTCSRCQGAGKRFIWS